MFPLPSLPPFLKQKDAPRHRRDCRSPFLSEVLKAMTKPPSPPSLADLRQEIDSIDEQVHQLLMQRGEIIDRLIAVKQTQEVGSAFRPAREADMMRRLVQRHHGILPLDTVESIWRVIIATFTYVQAPFSVHADQSLGESAMRDSARFHFGFTVPYVAHFSASAAVEAVAKSKGDLALVSATSGNNPWWLALEADGAPKIIARLPFIERADHPAALPVFVVSRVADSAMVTEVETWSIRCRAGAPIPPGHCRRWPTSWRSRIPLLTAPPCWCRSRRPAASIRSRLP